MIKDYISHIFTTHLLQYYNIKIRHQNKLFKQDCSKIKNEHKTRPNIKQARNYKNKIKRETKTKQSVVLPETKTRKAYNSLKDHAG